MITEFGTMIQPDIPDQNLHHLFFLEGFDDKVIHTCIQAAMAFFIQGTGGQGNDWNGEPKVFPDFKEASSPSITGICRSIRMRS